VTTEIAAEGSVRTVDPGFSRADLVFHLSVLMVDEGIDWADVGAELEQRAR